MSTVNPKQLIIALEPEAASIYCRKLRLRECVPDPYGSLPASDTPSPSTGAPKYTSLSCEYKLYLVYPLTNHYPAAIPASTSLSNLTLSAQSAPITDGIASSATYAADFKCGMKYLVADCGGGTVDLTVHELEDHGKLKELYKATGGAWGSMGVDYQFELLLLDIFGEEFLLDFVKTKPVSWLELLSLFETKKRGFSPHKELSVNISLPFSFIEHYREKTGRSVEAAIKEYGDGRVQWSHQGMMRLLPSIMMSLFEPVVSAIIHHIQELMFIPKLSNIEYLFLVGGFAESAVLQDAVRNAFRSNIRVIIPQDVSLTILKGAVLFGLDPTLVHVRRSALTYGVGCLNKFIPGEHPPEKRIIKDGVEWCTGIFDAFVFSDQAVSLGHEIIRSYSPAQADQKSTVITLFASEKDAVYFVSDPGCYKVGELRLDMPDTTGGKHRELRVSMIFGDTEISAEAEDMTSGKTASASIDFLNK